MKTITACMTAFLFLGISIVRADKPTEKIEAVDSCQITRAELELELSKVRRELAVLQIRIKYKLTDADTVDPSTLAITRGKAKPEPTKTADARKAAP